MVPHKWFTPLSYVAVSIGISTLVNGGMVQDTVLKKAHPNFHWQVAWWGLAILVAHIYSFAADKAWVGFSVGVWVAAGAMILDKTIDFFYCMNGCQGPASPAATATSGATEPSQVDLEAAEQSGPGNEQAIEGTRDPVPAKKQK